MHFNVCLFYSATEQLLNLDKMLSCNFSFVISDSLVEAAPIDVVENELKEAIDGLTERSAKLRLDLLYAALNKTYVLYAMAFLEIGLHEIFVTAN